MSPKPSNPVTWEPGIHLEIPTTADPAAWLGFETSVAAAARGSGNGALLLHAARSLTPANIARVRQIMEAKLPPGTGLHWLVVDDVVLARSTNADGVLFTQHPTKLSYSRTREVLGSSRYIARLVSSAEESPKIDDEPGRDEIDLLIVAPVLRDVRSLA